MTSRKLTVGIFIGGILLDKTPCLAGVFGLKKKKKSNGFPG
jgi:hypothetical protein